MLQWVCCPLKAHIGLSKLSIEFREYTAVNACMLIHSVVSNSLQPHGLYPAKLLCPWDSSGKNIGVGCHSLLQVLLLGLQQIHDYLCCRWTSVSIAVSVPEYRAWKTKQIVLKYFEKWHFLIKEFQWLISLGYSRALEKMRSGCSDVLRGNFPSNWAGS